MLTYAREICPETLEVKKKLAVIEGNLLMKMYGPKNNNETQIHEIRTNNEIYGIFREPNKIVKPGPREWGGDWLQDT